MLHNNIIAAIITFVLAVAWLFIMNAIAQKGWISSKVSRKIIHVGTGPLFVLCWILFDQNPNGRYLAAIVPFLNTVQFALVGLGLISDPAAVASMSRSGDKRELLRGPLLYGVVFVVITLIFWKDSMVGIIALMVLCGGDGLADIIGKKFGKNALPWSSKKTWIGSLGMFLGGFLLALIVLWVFAAAGVFTIAWGRTLVNLVVICFAATLVESLPLKDFDNLTVPIVCAALGLLLL